MTAEVAKLGAKLRKLLLDLCQDARGDVFGVHDNSIVEGLRLPRTIVRNSDKPRTLLLATEQTALLADVLAEIRSQLAHQLFLLHRQLLRDLDPDRDDMIAASRLADARNALPLAHDDVARLRPRLELDGRVAVAVVVERVDVDFTAERRLDEAHRELGHDVLG